MFFHHFRHNVTYSDLAKLFVAQVPRHVNYEILQLKEDLIATSLIRINAQTCQRVRLRTTMNTRYFDKDEIRIRPNCQFIKIQDEKAILRYDDQLECLVVSVTLKNIAESRHIVFTLEKHWRFGKILL